MSDMQHSPRLSNAKFALWSILYAIVLVASVYIAVPWIVAEPHELQVLKIFGLFAWTVVAAVIITVLATTIEQRFNKKR